MTIITDIRASLNDESILQPTQVILAENGSAVACYGGDETDEGYSTLNALAKAHEWSRWRLDRGDKFNSPAIINTDAEHITHDCAQEGIDLTDCCTAVEVLARIVEAEARQGKDYSLLDGPLGGGDHYSPTIREMLEGDPDLRF